MTIKRITYYLFEEELIEGTTAGEVHDVRILTHSLADGADPAAALYGPGLRFRGDTATQTGRDMAQIGLQLTDPADATRNSLLRVTTYPANGAVGYWGNWSAGGIDGGPRVVIPGGAGDVAACVYIGSVAKHSGGGTNAVSVSVVPDDSDILYNSDGNVLTAAVSAAGALTVARTSGTGTFDLMLHMLWL